MLYFTGAQNTTTAAQTYFTQAQKLFGEILQIFFTDFAFYKIPTSYLYRASLEWTI